MKNLSNQIKLLISFGFKSYESLPDSEKETLCALYIESIGVDALDCVLSDPTPIYKELINYLKTADLDSKYELVNAIVKNCLSYFEDNILQLFDEINESIQIENNYANGLRPYRYADNGETEWRLPL